MKELENDIISLMSDIVMHYDVHGEMPDDWLERSEFLIEVYFQEKEDGEDSAES